MSSNHLILCHLLLLPPLIFPRIRGFSNESALHIRWPKYWNFSFNISPINEHPELISFRMECLDLLAVQGTLKSLLQHHTSKASILRRSAFIKINEAEIDVFLELACFFNDPADVGSLHVELITNIKFWITFLFTMTQHWSLI